MTEQTSRLAIVLDSSGAKNNADNLATALNKMARAGEGAEKAADGVSDASNQTSDSAKKLAQSVEETHRRVAEFSKRLNETGSVAKASAASQDGLTEAYFRQIASIKDLSRDSQTLRDVQAALRIDRKEGNITQQDYLSLISQTTRREIELGAAEDQRAKKRAAFIQLLKGQVAAQSLSREELLRAKAAQLGAGSAADVYIKKLTGAGKTTEHFSLQTAAARRELGIMLSELARGNIGALRNSSITLANRSGLFDQLMSPKMLAATGLVGGLSSAVLGLGVAYYKGSQEQSEFYKSLTLTGNQAGKTTGQLADMAARVATASDSTTGTAAATLNKLVASGKVAASSLESVTTAIVKTSDATGISTDKLVDDFNKIAENPVQAIGELNDKYHFLTLATYNQIKALQDEGNQQEAARIATDAYSAAFKRRADEMRENLGLLEKAWHGLGWAAGKAWDAVFDIGREVSIEQKIADIDAAIEKARAVSSQRVTTGFTPLDNFNATQPKGDSAEVKALLAQRDFLSSQKISEDLISDIYGKGQKRQQDSIKNQQEFNKLVDAGETRQQKRAEALAKLEETIAKNKRDYESGIGDLWSPEKIAQARAGIESMYGELKKPKTAKTKQPKAYTDDAATRLLAQLSEQDAIMRYQLETSDKLNSATQARVKFEQQIADLQERQRNGQKLTDDQKSILSRSGELLNVYKGLEALQNSTKTLDDYRKMQDEIAPKELRQNETLQKRLEILQKMVALKKLTPEAAGQQASDLISRSVLPDSVISGVNKAGGTLTSGATNSDLSGQGLNMIGLQIDPQLEIIEKLKQAQMDYATWLNQQQQAITQSTVLNEQQKQQQLLALQQQGQQNQQALSTAVYVAQAQSAQLSFASITGSMGAMFGEQSSMYKAAFVTQKAFAIAQAALQLPMAMGQAMAGLPFPANLAALAQVMGLMSTITSSITSASLTGMAHNGIDSVPSTGTWLLEKGERVMTAQTSARLDSTLENLRKNGMDATLSKPGYGTGVQNVSNNNSQSVKQNVTIHQSIDASGLSPQELSLTLDHNNKKLLKEMKTEMTSEVISPKGAFGKALKSRYVRGYKE